MPTIDEMLVGLLRREGGFTQDKDDPAHQLRTSTGHKYDSYCTNHGITQYTLSNYWSRQATFTEVKALTKQQASDIYRYEYFIKPRLDELVEELQPVMFDMAVNHGPSRAVKLLQLTCSKAGYSLVTDGKIGFKTISKANQAYNNMGHWLVNALVEERLRFYKNLVKRRPRLSKFMKGWTRRANEFVVRSESQYVVMSFSERLMRLIS